MNQAGELHVRVADTQDAPSLDDLRWTGGREPVLRIVPESEIEDRVIGIAQTDSASAADLIMALDSSSEAPP